jgi:hypothetical protein
MPNLELHDLNEKLAMIEQRMDKSDKIARLSLRIAYVGFGVGIAAVILALLPFIIK